MKITSIRMKKNNIDNNNKILATVSIQLDDCLVIHGIKLVQLKDKQIVSFPNKKILKYESQNGNITQNYEYTDIVHPSNKEFREYVQNEIIKVYNSKEDLNNE